jgi:nucleotide-binding universal stress UspA family protein
MPKILNKILCPVGFDRNSVAGLKFAHELADGDKSTLYLLHVVSVPRMEPIMLEPNPVLSEGIAERELEKLAQQHLTSSAWYRIITRTGDPAPVIVAVANELNVDLILMPTHGGKDIAILFWEAFRSASSAMQRGLYLLYDAVHVRLSSTA